MLPTEGPAAARAAGLRYTTDATPGIRRIKKRSKFAYVAPDGSPVTDRDELARIAALAVPPAYVDVWISPIANGHLQATGRDARGRKQYRYHKRWRAIRDETKFDRMVAFAKALPAIRGAVDRDLKLAGLPREKILATVVSLLEETSIRVGNEEYARDNDSYGLTTLEPKHVEITPTKVSFRFRGKSGKDHAVTVRDRRIARIVQASRDLPGQKLFEYLDDAGEPHPIHSDDVNAYLRDVAGDDFSAKDFRTWEATMLCAVELAAVRVEGVGEAKAAVVEAVKRVAQRLGNTPAVCKKSYIHPGVIEAFLADGALRLVAGSGGSRGAFALDRHERAVVALVESLAERERQPLAKVLAASVRAHSAKRTAAARTRGPRQQPHRSVGGE